MFTSYSTDGSGGSVVQYTMGIKSKVGQEIKDEWTLSISENVLFQQLDHGEGEVVILDIQSGGYFGLNEVGGSIWLLIQEQKRLGAVLEALVQNYDASEDRLRSDLAQFITELHARGLIEVHENGTG